MKHTALIAGLVTAAALVLPTQSAAQRSGVEIWSANCGRCHLIQPPDRYTAKDWESIGVHMIVTARLTTAEGDAVLAFLRQGAARMASGAQAAGAAEVADATGVHFLAIEPQGPSPAEVFSKQCAACHGAEGKGDGPAAVAFNPRPADFMNPELFRTRTDADLAKSITEGVRGMPPFGAQIAPEMVSDLVKYVRGLSGGAPGPGRSAS
jgi:mono/diheme cytochrome c family protein